MRSLVLACLLATPAFADGEPAGRFDYYVLSLSWSPTWCTLNGDARGDAQCDGDRNFAFTLHGLWPQYELGWPSYCRTNMPEATRSETASMADIMGSAGLAWHEWKKHGRCAGLSAADYFATARAAYRSIIQPAVFTNLNRDLTLPASVLEDAFIEANPVLERNMITVTCDQGEIAEVRICLDPYLNPRACGEDAARDCKMTRAHMGKIR